MILKITLIIAIILLLPVLVSSPEFTGIDAIIILPNITAPSIYTTPIEVINDPIDSFDNLTYFIHNDSTNEYKYIKGEYMCMDFSIDLAINLTKAGYESGIVLIPSHAIVWVSMPEPYNTLYIAPRHDTIHHSFDYNNSKEITISHANRLRNEMHQYGYY